MKIEIVVPVRPGDIDKYPVRADNVINNTVECADGNLSKLYKDAYLASSADIVIFKHDDLWIRNWDDYIHQVMYHLDNSVVVGIAGARTYAPNRNVAWWEQSKASVGQGASLIDGLNRGLVLHPSNGTVNSKYVPIAYGEPGYAAVMDGCLLAVAKKKDYYYNYTEKIGVCFDTNYTYHFYDISFTMNIFRIFGDRSCYVIVADIAHDGIGLLTEDWHEAARRFIKQYSVGMPLMAEGC